MRLENRISVVWQLGSIVERRRYYFTEQRRVNILIPSICWYPHAWFACLLHHRLLEPEALLGNIRTRPLFHHDSGISLLISSFEWRERQRQRPLLWRYQPKETNKVMMPQAVTPRREGMPLFTRNSYILGWLSDTARSKLSRVFHTSTRPAQGNTTVFHNSECQVI